MRTNLIIFLIVALILSGCSSASKARRAKRLISEAIAAGLPVDSTKTKITETAKFEGAKASGETKAEPDPDSLWKYCEELLRLPPQPSNLIINPDAQLMELLRNGPVTKIQREVCPQKTVDLRDSVTLTLQGTKYRIPFRLFIEARDGVLKHEFKIDDLNAKYTKEEVTVSIHTGDSFWKKLGRSNLWMFIGIVVGAGGVYLGRILRVLP